MSQAVKVRASSLSELFDCPARWASKHIDGKVMPSNSRATLGKAVHASTALFDQSVLDGGQLTSDETAAAAVDAIYKSDEDIDWEDEKPSDIEKIALALHGKYCGEIAPTKKYSAVEVECESLHITDINLILTGTTDRIVEKDNGHGIADLKTGKTIVKTDGTVETKGHAYQIGVYELLAEHASGIPITEPGEIIGLNAGKTDKGQRIGTGYISDAKEVLIGSDEMPGVLQTASNLIHSGVFWGNPKSMLCSEKYCPIYRNCHYRK